MNVSLYILLFLFQSLVNITVESEANCTAGVPCWMENNQTWWTQKNITETINLEKCEWGVLLWEGWIRQGSLLPLMPVLTSQTIRPSFPLTTSPWGQWFSFSGVWFGKDLTHLSPPSHATLMCSIGLFFCLGRITWGHKTGQKRPSRIEKKACGWGHIWNWQGNLSLLAGGWW